MRKTVAVFLIICCFISMYSCSRKENRSDGDSELFSDGKVSNDSFEEGLSRWTESGNGISVTGERCFEGKKSLMIGSTGEYHARLHQRIHHLVPGYYYLEVNTFHEGNEEYCYIYGKGSGQDKCMTSVPVTAKTGKWSVTTVRGIKVEQDGALEIGIEVKGKGRFSYFDGICLKFEANQAYQYPSLFGGAISWLDWEEDAGAKYYDEYGNEKDAILILKENGCNFVRLELYNNPGAYSSAEGDYFPEGYKNADAIFRLAKRADALGMKMQLSFMYSDYWGNEAIPSDWLREMDGMKSDEEKREYLTQAIYRYTRSFMTRLKEAGIYPEYVSIGNEIDGGILLPYGSSTASGESVSALAGFLNSGYKAVKEVSPNSKVVLHISCNADDMHWQGHYGMGRWFFDLMEEKRVKYDLIGTSFYPFWAQNSSEYSVKRSLDLNDLKEWSEMMTDRYDKDILIMESGYNWGVPGQLSDNGAYSGIYASSPEGQREYVIDLINTVKSVKDGRCTGCLYWDPILVRQEGVGYALYGEGKPRENVVETTTFFDYEHIALPVLKAYRYNTVGRCP